MAVSLERSTSRYRGLSTDDKPGIHREVMGAPVQRPTVGSVFTETDTGCRYIFSRSNVWVRQEQTIEPLLERLIDVGLQVVDLLSAIKRGHEEHLWEEEVEPE